MILVDQLLSKEETALPPLEAQLPSSQDTVSKKYQVKFPFLQPMELEQAMFLLAAEWPATKSPAQFIWLPEVPARQAQSI